MISDYTEFLILLVGGVAALVWIGWKHEHLLSCDETSRVGGPDRWAVFGVITGLGALIAGLVAVS